LRHVKEPYKYEEKYFLGKIHGHFSPSFSLLCYYVPVLVIARGLQLMGQK
jgi:hypothetical protein